MRTKRVLLWLLVLMTLVAVAVPASAGSPGDLLQQCYDVMGQRMCTM